MRTLRPRKIFEYIMLSYPSLTHTFVNENCNIWGGGGECLGPREVNSGPVSGAFAADPRRREGCGTRRGGAALRMLCGYGPRAARDAA